MRNQRMRTVWFLSSVFITLLVLLQSCNLPFPEKEQSLSSQIESLRNLQSASTSDPAFTFQNGFPLSGRFDIPVSGANSIERARNFLSTYSELYGQTNPDFALELLRASGENGEHVVFYQTYKDIPVFGAELIVQLDSDHVIFTSGNLLHGDVLIDTTPILTAFEAESVAKSSLNAPDASIQEVTKLMIYDRSLKGDVAPDPHLVWRVILSRGPTHTYVDALDGKVISSYVLSESGYELDLEHANDSNAEVSNCYYTTDKDDRIGDEESIYEEYLYDQDAVNIWQYAHDAYNFYHFWGRDSYDNDGAELEVYIRAGVNNAQWTSGCEVFEFGLGWVGQDIMVHEFTHAVISHTSELIYEDQSGALSESFADLMAAAQDGNWIIGEAMTIEPQLRDLSQPRDMSVYDDMYYCGGYGCVKEDNGGVHTNSLIHSYVAYLLAVGGTHNGFTVQSIGAQKETVLMLNVMYNLSSSAQFVQARDWAVAWAVNWVNKNEGGWTLSDVCQVRNAYAAVGISPEGADFDCDGIEDAAEVDADNDGLYDEYDNCPHFASSNKWDTDLDGMGDVCDPDQDNDSVPNENDNCALISNSGQEDVDDDGVGDACQDTDDDKLVDVSDNCPLDKNYDQYDNEGDGLGDVCDPDDDNDGVLDETDNAVFVANSGQEDADKDNVGDKIDNCVDNSNEDQSNVDHDSEGDVCDTDKDNDGLNNRTDNCPDNFNPEQLDLNGNGVGAACDEEDQAVLEEQFQGLVIPLLANPGSMFKIKIPGCAGGCPDDWGYDTFLWTVQVEGLIEGGHVFVTDDTGSIVKKSVDDGAFQEIRFHPLGGSDHFLNFVFGPETEGEQQVEVKVTVLQGTAPGAPQPTPTSTLVTSVTAPTLTLTKNAFCRKGADISFEDVDAILAGETVEILNISPDNSWYYVFWERKNAKCWVAVGTGNVNGDLQDIEVLIGPPTLTPAAVPIEPSPTATGKP